MPQTEHIKIENKQDIQKAITKAVSILMEGGLVAFPTETVYGLGVNSINEKAVRKLFEVKGRPFNNPLTYHLPFANGIKTFVEDFSPAAQIFSDKLLPGPLMLVFKKSETVKSLITGGSNKIGIRVPDNRVCHELLKKADFPIVATSANLSGRPAPVTAEQVLHDLDGKIDLIIEGIEQPLGIESTIIDITLTPPRVLRLGFISQEDIETATGIKVLLSTNNFKNQPFFKFLPKTTSYLIEGNQEDVVKRMSILSEQYYKKGKQAFIITEESSKLLETKEDIYSMGRRENVVEIAQGLFSLLRKLEEDEVNYIFIEGIPRIGLGHAIMQRLTRLATYIERV